MIFADLISFEILFRVVTRTLIIFLFAFFILRLLGKKHLSHLTYLDLLLIIALGSAVGDVMIYDESTAQIFSSMVAICMVGLLVKALDEFSSRSRRAGFLITGNARMIIKNGRVIEKALAQEDLSQEDLMMILREKGYYEIKKISRAFIEPDGEISVIKR